MRKSSSWFPCLLRALSPAPVKLAAFFSAVVVFGAVALQATESSTAGISLTGQRVLVLGDSITQDGRYVSFFEYALLRESRPIRCDLVSVGLSSETISGLSEKGHPFPRPCVLERLDRALKAVKPTIVFACYGMNDGIYHPLAADRTATFESGLHRFVAAVRAAGAQLVLVTPPVFDSVPIRSRLVSAEAAHFGYDAPFERYDEVLAEFSRIERALHEPGVRVIDLHSTMSAELVARREKNPTFSFTADGVHPGDEGHALIARVILEALGVPTPSALAVGADPQALKSDPLFRLVDERRRLLSEAWLPFIGYTRGDTFKSASIDAAQKVAARLTAEIDSQLH